MALFDELMDFQEETKDRETLIPGFLLGTIKENWDSKHPGMVKVELILSETGKNVSDWIPVATPYGGKEFGQYFLPEIGDQVMVAFHGGHPDCPVVIGSLWNTQNTPPPNAPNEKNTTKLIRTKGGHTIIFNEEKDKETITIQTPGSLTICLDDEKQKAAIQDKDGKNGIVIDIKNGTIILNAEKKVQFKVNGQEMLILDGEGKKAALKADTLNCEASQTLKLKGQSTSLEGNTLKMKGQNTTVESSSLNLKGQGSIKVESSGILQLKGAMAKIN